MKNVAYEIFNGPKDLPRLGISPLTGEACAYSQRLLCDVSAAGLQLLQEFLGAMQLALPPNMNSRVGDDAAAVGSVMLPRSLWQDLVRFYAFRSGALAYLDSPDGSIYVLYDEEILSRYASSLSSFSVVRNPTLGSSHPREGSRNVHAATGRVL